MNYIIPLTTAILSVIFAIAVLKQFLERKKLHQIVWTIGLFLFAVASFIEFYAEYYSWCLCSYKAYFFITAIMVSILALGTLYLLVDKRIGHGFSIFILIISIAFIYVLSSAVQIKDFTANEIPSGILSKGSYFHPLLDVPSALILIIGAIYSWFKTKEKFNLLISSGAIIFTFTGFLPRIGLKDSIYFYSVHLIAIIVFFIGFLWSAEIRKEKL